MTLDKADEQSVLDDVFKSGRDRGADSAAPKDDANNPEIPEAKAAEVKEDGEAEAKPKGYRDPESGRFVPLEELRSEREKRQDAQKSRDEEVRLRVIAEENSKRYQAQLDDIHRRMQAAQNPPQPPPDVYTDPEGAFQHQERKFQYQMQQQTLNFSEMRARDKHGDGIVDEALQDAIKLGVNQHFLRAADPYKALVDWHKSQKALQEIGPDPEKYKTTLKETMRQQILEELKTGKANGSQPQRFPGSLVDATASGAQGAQAISDEAMLGSIFASNRKRR